MESQSSCLFTDEGKLIIDNEIQLSVAFQEIYDLLQGNIIFEPIFYGDVAYGFTAER